MIGPQAHHGDVSSAFLRGELPPRFQARGRISRRSSPVRNKFSGNLEHLDEIGDQERKIFKPARRNKQAGLPKKRI
jgi:hypothetical protein